MRRAYIIRDVSYPTSHNSNFLEDLASHSDAGNKRYQPITR